MTLSVIRLASYGGPGWRGRGGKAVLLFIPGTAHTHTLACIAQTAQKATRGSATPTNTHLHVSWWQVVQ